MLQRRSYGLDTLELKALSVPSSLRFLLGVEYDVVLCVTEVGTRRPFALHFPVFAETFRKLLGLCAQRYSLQCTHTSDGSVLRGTVVMPLLRYADYLPCALHVEELLAALQVTPVSKAQRRLPRPTATAAVTPSHVDVHKNDTHGSAAVVVAATTTAALSSSASAAAASSTTVVAPGNEFTACFLDYTEFRTDASLSDVHGLGFYLMHDYGLSLATHAHLVHIRFHRSHISDAAAALRAFQAFSGWASYDLRFFDELDRLQGGVIVLPSVQDASDLLERYEDEDSDDEGELLPFVLRPVRPLVHVPAIEDAALRRLREQHWDEIVRFWSRFPTTRHTVVVSNLYDGATLDDVCGLFDDTHGGNGHAYRTPHTAPRNSHNGNAAAAAAAGKKSSNSSNNSSNVVRCSLVEDNSPMHRRRAFVTFATATAARKALELDGKSTRGRTLRVQVAPPYISSARWGREVTPPSPSPSSTMASPQQAQLQQQSDRNNNNNHNNNSRAAGTTTTATTTARAAPSPMTTPQHRPLPNNNGDGNGSRGHTHAPQPRSARVPSSNGTTAAAAADNVASARHAVSAHTASHGSAAHDKATVATTTTTRAPPHHTTEVPATTTTTALCTTPAVSPSLRPMLAAAVASASAATSTSRARVTSASTSPSTSLMNADAKEFVPHFLLHADALSYHGAAAPLLQPQGGADGLLPPPPPPPPPPLPPSLQCDGNGGVMGEDEAMHLGYVVSVPPPPPPPPAPYDMSGNYVVEGIDHGVTSSSLPSSSLLPPPPPPPPYSAAIQSTPATAPSAAVPLGEYVSPPLSAPSSTRLTHTFATPPMTPPPYGMPPPPPYNSTSHGGSPSLACNGYPLPPAAGARMEAMFALPPSIVPLPPSRTRPPPPAAAANTVAAAGVSSGAAVASHQPPAPPPPPPYSEQRML